MLSARQTMLACLLTVSFFAAALPSSPQDKPAESKGAGKAQKAVKDADLPAVLWHDPGEISSLDLTTGAGGKEHAPDANDEYKFIKEDLNATSTKFYVEDSHGVRWLVKVAEEAKPETAATRLVWAVGYFADEDYYVERFHVSGMPRLTRPKPAIAPDGTVTGARLKREGKEDEKVANWSWTENPFVGTRELNGLRALMALLNNWDLTTANNKIYEVDGMEKRYVVSDLGASFGKTGGSSTRSKGVLKDYRNSPFIERAQGDFVDFTMATRPFALKKLSVPDYYKMRVKIEMVAKHIPRADVRWIAQRLAQLTPQQIRDAFRGAGYNPADAEAYAQAVELRIAALKTL